MGAGVVQTVIDDVKGLDALASLHTSSAKGPGACVVVDVGMPEQSGLYHTCRSPPEVHVVPEYLTESLPRLPLVQAPGNVKGNESARLGEPVHVRLVDHKSWVRVNVTTGWGLGGVGVGAGVHTVIIDAKELDASSSSSSSPASLHTPSVPVPGASVSVDAGVPEQFEFCQSCAMPPEVHVVPEYLTESLPKLPVMQAPGDVM